MPNVEYATQKVVEFLTSHGPAALNDAFKFTQSMLATSAGRIAKMVIEAARHTPSLLKLLNVLAAAPHEQKAQQDLKGELANVLNSKSGAELQLAIAREVKQSQASIQQNNQDASRGTIINGDVQTVTIN